MGKTLKRIIGYVRPYKKYLLAAVIFSLLGVSLSLFVPILIGRGVDFIVGENAVDFKELAKLAAVLAGIVLVSTFFQWLTALATNKLSYNTIRDIRTELFDTLNGVPLKFIDKSSKGELISRAVNDIEIISDGLLQGFTQLFSGIITILGTLVFMLTINIKIALLVVILTPLSLFTAAKITRLSKNSFTEQSTHRGELNGLAEEMIGNQKIVKAFSYEKRAEAGFKDINDKMAQSGVKAVFFSSMTNPTTRFVNGLIYAAVGTAGALSAIGALSFFGKISIGQLTSFLSYSNQYTKPFNEISGVVAELQNAVASAERVFSVIDEPYFAEPAGPYGDRVLVIEHHFLLGSSGDIYYVPAGLPFALKQGSFSCDDAYSPMRAGSYSLSWSDRTAALSVWSDTAADPMVPWNGKVGPGW